MRRGRLLQDPELLDPLLSNLNPGKPDYKYCDFSVDSKPLLEPSPPGMGDGAPDETSIVLTIADARFYRYAILNEILFWLLIICTGGLYGLVVYWHPLAQTSIRFRRVSSDSTRVDCVLVEAPDKKRTLCEIEAADPQDPESGWIPLHKARQLHGARAQDFPRSFEYRHARLFFSSDTRDWTRYDFDSRLTPSALHALAATSAVERGKSPEAGARGRVAFGRNELNIRVPSIFYLILAQILRPFVCFQIFSIIIWYIQEYTLFASLILGLTLIAVVQAGVSDWRSLHALQRLAMTDGRVKRARVVAGRISLESVPASDLVPGDVIVVQSGAVMHCDALLLSGACIVSESMLTGESVPVLKSALPIDPDIEDHVDVTRDRDARFVLFSGTTVLQAKPATAAPEGVPSRDSEELSTLWQLRDERQSFPVLAVVARTGFSTSRGQLVRLILFPKPMKFDFEKQSLRFIWILIGGLVLGGAAQIAIYISYGESAYDTILDLLNLVTIAVPPALPLALSFGVAASLSRLRRAGIFCAISNRISAAGRVNLLAFDKTGTLTEDGLSLNAVLATSRDASGTVVFAPPSNDVPVLLRQLVGESGDSHMADVLVGCHSLSMLDVDAAFHNDDDDDAPLLQHENGENDAEKAPKTADGGATSLVGDPLELSMFETSGWSIVVRPPPSAFPPSGIWAHPLMPLSVTEAVVPPPPTAEHIYDCAALAVLRRFDFDPELRRMSTLVLRLPRDGSTDAPKALLLLKGAPESVNDLCVQSTVPADVAARLGELTRRGLRVLSCGFRIIDSADVATCMKSARGDVERGLTFGGLLVMENRLKPTTIDALCGFAAAALRIVMVTGDNALTAVAVAKQCGPVFVRPWRPTLLVDVVAERVIVEYAPEDGGAAISVSLDALLAERAPGSRSMMEMANQSAPVSEWANQGVEMGNSMENGAVAAQKEVVPATFPADCDLAVTGRAFNALLSNHVAIVRERALSPPPTKSILERGAASLSPFEAVLSRATVFARMSPQDKQELVRAFQDMNYVVCMTGDGANDSNALKTADVGISIAAREENLAGKSGGKSSSLDEQAVAAAPSIAAPFSTRMHTIDAVRKVLVEGRQALVTSFSLFKFMFEYGVIQFVTVLIVYAFLFELADNQYIFEDIVLVFSICTAIPLLKGLPKVSRGKPECNLLAPSVLRSVIGHVVILITFQIGHVVFLVSQPFYASPDTKDPGTKEGRRRYGKEAYCSKE